MGKVPLENGASWSSRFGAPCVSSLATHGPFAFVVGRRVFLQRQDLFIPEERSWSALPFFSPIHPEENAPGFMCFWRAGPVTRVTDPQTWQSFGSQELIPTHWWRRNIEERDAIFL